MFEHDRQQQLHHETDPKTDEAAGKLFGAAIVFVFFLGLVQMAIDALSEWYNSTVAWLAETWTYFGSMWPF